MRIGIMAAALWLTATSLAPAAQIETGRVAGARLPGGVVAYRGIPFAAPPLGDLRWRPPQPAPSWTGARRADTFAPACPQKGVSMPGETPPATSEDCLYLNVWTPARHGSDRLPVMVWIHGGGYANGATAMPLYSGDRLAAKGVVVVTVAYRLGPLGFLAHPELTQESARSSSGNYGLMDQIAALRWVQRNISAFGGDPARVTVAGQSAGAMAVSILMASPAANGLFHQAIGQSGGLFEPLQLAPGYQLANAEKDGVAYAASLGASSLADLRRLPAEALLGGKAASVSHPVIEPVVLPAAPYDAFAAGRQAPIPVLVGSNAEEARALVDVSGVKAATFGPDLMRAFGPLPPALLDAYPHATDAEARQARLDLERDLRFGWDMWAWARLQAWRGPVHTYHFTQRPPFPAASVRAGWGASHFAELWYMFDHLDQEPWAWTAADHRLASAMSSYWVNFVRFGDPNGPGLPPWPAFTLADQAVMRLGDPVEPGGVANRDRLEVFDKAYGQVRGLRPPPRP